MPDDSTTQKLRREPYPDEYLLDDITCPNCKKETPHALRDGGHERDSSADRKECLVCGWYSLGMFSGYRPPYTYAV